MVEITRERANEIIREHLHQKLQGTRVVACFRGRWFDIRGLSKQEIASEVTKIFKFSVNPDAII